MAPRPAGIVIPITPRRSPSGREQSESQEVAQAQASIQLPRDELDLGLTQIAEALQSVNAARRETGSPTFAAALLTEALDDLIQTLPYITRSQAPELDRVATALEGCIAVIDKPLGAHVAAQLRAAADERKSPASVALCCRALRRTVERNELSAASAIGEVVGELQAIGNTLYEANS